MDGKFCYERIKAFIIEKIEQGQYPSDKIESENQLCQLFSTSRMTVRQALQTLQEEGYIYTIPKKGSFVSRKKAMKELDGLHSFSEDMFGKANSEVICFEQTNQVPKQMHAHAAWYLKRIRYDGEIAVAYEEGYFNADLLPSLAKEHATQSIYAYIEEKGYQLDHAQQEISAVHNPIAAKMMNVDVKSPFLKVSQTTYTKEEQCIECCDTYYVGNRYCFKQNAYRK